MRNSAGAWPSSAEPNSDRHPNSKTSQQWDTPVDSDIGGARSICASPVPHTLPAPQLIPSPTSTNSDQVLWPHALPAPLSRRQPVGLTWKTGHTCPLLGRPGKAEDRITYLECIRQGLQMSDGMGAPIPPPQA